MMQSMPHSWRMVKLGLCLQRRKDTVMPATLDDDFVGLVGLEDIQDCGRGGITIRQTRPQEIDSLKTRFNAGDILYGKLRPYLNKVGIAPQSGICSTEIWAFTTSPFITSQYATFFLASSFFVDRVESLTKGANLPRLDSNTFDTIEIPLPPLSEQQQIVEILQEAEEIRRFRAEAEAKTAELIPAIFFAHFQDELRATYSHSHRLADLCSNDEDVKCGPFGTQLRQDEFTREGVPLWGIKHVNSNFKVETEEFLSAEKAEELSSYSLKSGDIVMTRKGTIGNCAIYPDHLPQGIMHSDLLRIRLDTSRFNPVFVSAQLALSPVVEKQISSQSAGAVMPGINVTRLKELKVFVIPPQKQQLFADEVAEVAAIDSLEHRSRSDESRLLASLALHAFSGRITADWREANKDKLTAEGNERDAALKEGGSVVSIAKPMAEEIAELLKDRTDGIYADLNREQRLLLREIKRMFAGVDYGRYFTAEQLAADIKGSLHRHPQRIESHLSLFATRGLIIPISRRRDDNIGPAYAACYRLAIAESLAANDDNTSSNFSDDIRAAMLATQRNLVQGRG